MDKIETFKDLQLKNCKIFGNENEKQKLKLQCSVASDCREMASKLQKEDVQFSLIFGAFNSLNTFF